MSIGAGQGAGGGGPSRPGTRACWLLVPGLLALGLAVSAGATPLRGQPPPVPHERQLVETFNRAIADSAVYRHSHLRRLRPLSFDPGTGTALVATLTARRYRPGRVTLPHEVWVTGVPEVRRKCRKVHDRRGLGLWLRELLGLHPNTRIRSFVTFSVARSDIFRPTADPTTTTRWPCRRHRSSTCGLAFPAGVSQDHVRWMANEMLSSWIVATPFSTDGYPWTRLGYTYDWRPGAAIYGASEYVIRAGAAVEVESVVPYRSYCE